MMIKKRRRPWRLNSEVGWFMESPLLGVTLRKFSPNFTESYYK
jgi:hypothetical protein